MMESPEKLVDKILRCPNLPMIPGIPIQVLKLTEDSDVSAQHIAEVMGHDPVLAARVLRAANSLVPRNVFTLSHAVALLGMRSVMALALGVSLSGMFRRSCFQGEDVEILWRRSLYSALAGRMLSKLTRLAQPDEAFLGGLFQDVGMLGMLAVMGEEYHALIQTAGNHESMVEVERRELGIDHPAVGIAMAKAWSLPARLSAPIEFHHCPQDAPAQHQPLARLVWASRITANVLLADDTIAAAAEARDMLVQQFDLQGEQIQEILEALATQAQDLAELFDIKVISGSRMNQILCQANETLMQTALEADAEAQRLLAINRKLTETAGLDPMTGLQNRACFETVRKSLADKSKGIREPLAVLFIDADHFKSINDTFGHDTGDRVLKRLGQIIAERCEHNAYRYGGEEIICLLNGYDEQAATALAEDIRRDVESKPVQTSNGAIPFTVSIGVAIGDPRENDIEHLLGAVDEAVYAAKNQGRNSVYLASQQHTAP